MEQIDRERFFTMAHAYNKMARILVPNYDLMQDEVFNIIDFNEDKEMIVADLGAGSGIFLEKILDRFQNSKCYWIDFSEDFLGVARKRLEKFDKRVIYILSSIEENWQEKIESGPDLIFSMSAIHHLTTIEKKSLYASCFHILNSGGWFFNIDEMKTNYEDSYLNSLNYWYRHVMKSRKSIGEEDLMYYEKWLEHFEGWKKRNIENIDKPKVKGDDIHESYIDQLTWLRADGFINVDMFVKYHLWCLIGGEKR